MKPRQPKAIRHQNTLRQKSIHLPLKKINRHTEDPEQLQNREDRKADANAPQRISGNIQLLLRSMKKIAEAAFFLNVARTIALEIEMALVASIKMNFLLRRGMW